MFGYIKGIVTEIFLNYVIIENSDIGFKLSTSQFTNRKLEIGKEAKLYTKLNVREDDISLLGFADRRELKMYELLNSVSKVGPKVAFSVLSTYDTDSLQAIINNSDATLLAKSPGVGKKTAERIILELRDKVDKKAVGMQPSIYNIFEADYDEAIEVLISLGFSKMESSKAVEAAKAENLASDTSEIIKISLGKLSKI
ncbi:Holliday junction branch migration protein RuvA [Proteocatella sphenisci]|uniref:Holliday junction branch migration protein RuvA n=1 Tax=Proteocatella sphenisci TaxID=181070 RepID=UPI000490974D|nr:Holliday junction branch migration protein RuvA [Proteocatella sphenisci]